MMIINLCLYIATDYFMSWLTPVHSLHSSNTVIAGNFCIEYGGNFHIKFFLL